MKKETFMITILEKPEILPVSLEDVKIHLKIEHHDENDYLTHLIETATENIQNVLNRSLIKQKILYQGHVKKRKDGLAEISLPRPNIILVESVKSVRLGHVYTPVKRFHIHHEGMMQKIIAYTEDDVLEVVYEAGYGIYQKHIPSPIKHGILKMVANLYENRGHEDNTFQTAHYHFLKPYKVMGFEI